MYANLVQNCNFSTDLVKNCKFSTDLVQNCKFITDFVQNIFCHDVFNNISVLKGMSRHQVEYFNFTPIYSHISGREIG